MESRGPQLGSESGECQGPRGGMAAYERSSGVLDRPGVKSLQQEQVRKLQH